jgi:hypothetical protein
MENIIIILPAEAKEYLWALVCSDLKNYADEAEHSRKADIAGNINHSIKADTPTTALVQTILMPQPERVQACIETLKEKGFDAIQMEEDVSNPIEQKGLILQVSKQGLGWQAELGFTGNEDISIDELSQMVLEGIKALTEIYFNFCKGFTATFKKK